MPSKRPTLLLSAKDVTALLDMRECIAAVEQGFRLLGEGKLPPAEILGLHAKDGGLHIKAAIWNGKKSYFVAKANANFPGNPAKLGLPTIQGVVIVSDAETGELLALMDSIEVTALRTAAASAVAAKYLARKDSKVLTICGCGRQGYSHLEAISAVLPIETVYAYDSDGACAGRFAEFWKSQVSAKGRREPGAPIHVKAIAELQEATLKSDVIATCTPAREAFLDVEQVRPGTFIAAVGADSDHKSEITPRLMAQSKLVVDSLAQCTKIGDLHQAFKAGLAPQVHAELAEVVAGNKPGRVKEGETIIFDSTGIAVEDAAAAVLLVERASADDRYQHFAF